MLQRQTRDQVCTARMAHGVDMTQPQNLKKTVGMLYHGRHRVVFVAPRVVGEALTDFVDGKDVKPAAEIVEVQAPIVGAVGGIVGAKVTAVKKHNDRATTFFEIARADSIHINKFFTDHCFLLSGLRYCNRPPDGRSTISSPPYQSHKCEHRVAVYIPPGC